MIALAISLLLLLTQTPAGQIQPRTGGETIPSDLYRVICEPAPDVSNARNSTLYSAYLATAPGRYRMSEADWNGIDRASRERLIAEASERLRLWEIADFPRLSPFIVDTLNRFGNGETARVVSAALQAQVCR